MPVPELLAALVPLAFAIVFMLVTTRFPLVQLRILRFGVIGLALWAGLALIFGFFSTYGDPAAVDVELRNDSSNPLIRVTARDAIKVQPGNHASGQATTGELGILLPSTGADIEYKFGNGDRPSSLVVTVEDGRAGQGGN